MGCQVAGLAIAVSGPRPGAEKPLNNPRKAFTRILDPAGIAHARTHDLRHSFSDLAVNSAVSLYPKQELLGALQRANDAALPAAGADGQAQRRERLVEAEEPPSPEVRASGAIPV